MALPSTLFGFALGVLSTLLVQRQRAERSSARNGSPDFLPAAINTPQLLAWIDDATQGWLILTPDLTISYINARAERLLRISRNFLVRGLPIQQVLAVPQLDEVISSALYQQRPQRSEWNQRGEPLEALVLPGSDQWLLLLIQSRQSLEAQQQQQERWVSDVAHELKTPLTSLMLVSDRLELAVDDDDIVLVQRLQRELRRLQLMVEDLLELSRLENSLPQASGTYSALSLADLVEGAWSSIRPLAETRQVELRFDESEPGPLMGDRPRLHRAVLNLLDNALRFSPDGAEVEVVIRPSGGWWLLSIRDHGQGLSESDLGNMFRRFYRGDPSRARSARSGSGLGLAIVQQIAVNHGGRVEARNHPDGGTCMELLLPKSMPAL